MSTVTDAAKTDEEQPDEEPPELVISKLHDFDVSIDTLQKLFAVDPDIENFVCSPYSEPSETIKQALLQSSLITQLKVIPEIVDLISLFSVEFRVDWSKSETGKSSRISIHESNDYNISYAILYADGKNTWHNIFFNEWIDSPHLLKKADLKPENSVHRYLFKYFSDETNINPDQNTKYSHQLYAGFCTPQYKDLEGGNVSALGWGSGESIAWYTEGSDGKIQYRGKNQDIIGLGHAHDAIDWGHFEFEKYKAYLTDEQTSNKDFDPTKCYLLLEVNLIKKTIKVCSTAMRNKTNVVESKIPDEFVTKMTKHKIRIGVTLQFQRLGYFGIGLVKQQI